MTERTTSAADRGQGRGGRGGQAPQRPTQLPGGSWWAAVKRTVREFQVDNLSDWAAALTYYSVLQRAVDLPRSAGADLPDRPGRPRNHPEAVGQPRPGRPRLGQPDPARCHH